MVKGSQGHFERSSSTTDGFSTLPLPFVIPTAVEESRSPLTQTINFMEWILKFPAVFIDKIRFFKADGPVKVLGVVPEIIGLDDNLSRAQSFHLPENLLQDGAT